MKPSLSDPDPTICSHPNMDMVNVPFQGRCRKGQGCDEKAPLTKKSNPDKNFWMIVKCVKSNLDEPRNPTRGR